jgi:hypothetical protein
MTQNRRLAVMYILLAVFLSLLLVLPSWGVFALVIGSCLAMAVREWTR